MTEAVGEVENDDGALVLKRIDVRYTLRVDPDADRAKIQRAFDHHAGRCPVYRSISDAVDIATLLEIVDDS